MKVSLNTVKRYTTIDLSVDELVGRINAQLGGVEDVVDLSVRYKDAVIVRVVSSNDHPNADRLHVCLVDDGGAFAAVPRNENGFVQVVCGAPNVRADMLAVWLPPVSTVPASFSDKEPFVLAARELRGVMSYGMLASPQELALGDSHDGILELKADEQIDSASALKPGASFAKVYGLDDTIIDIENKMFTHRPDCFGQLGVAREIAGIQGKAFTSPDWYKALPEINSGEGLQLTVNNQALDKVPRFMAVAVKDVQIRQSPVWLQAELVRLGSKPINNVVDVTNYIMLLTGQPLHAYDYDKLANQTLGARAAQDGESLTLLNGKTYALTADDVVIVDGDGPVGLGGVMGGGDSEVSATTTRIVLESATFDMYSVRKTSMRHGLFTDAVTRFNKGQSPFQNDRALALALMAVADVADGVVASQVFDEKDALVQPAPIAVSVPFINERLGLELAADDIRALLENVECQVAIGDTLLVTPPFWRTDLEIAEDIVEEVGRLYGFDKLPRVLPSRTTKPALVNDGRELKRLVRDSLAKAGASEVLTYSFINEKVMTRAEQDVSQAFRLSNALSPDLQYYRLSVLPSLLDKVHANIKAGHAEFALFEIGKGHNKKHHLSDDEGLPSEMEFVDIVYANKKSGDGAAFYRMRRLAGQLADDLRLGELVYEPITEPMDYPVTAPFELSRSALVKSSSGIFIGIIGELKKTVIQDFKLPAYCAAASLDLAGLYQARAQADNSTYRPLSRFPKVAQDISLKVPFSTAYAPLCELVRTALLESELGRSSAVTVTPLSIYQAENDDNKTFTFRVELTSYEATLTDKDVGQVLDAVSNAASQAFHAERV